MPVQSAEPLREKFAAEVSTPIEWLWTWGGASFGYRQGESLFTYDGRSVGRFVGDEVYGANGKYLGELRSTGQDRRLTASNYKNSRVVATFSPKAGKAYERRANRLPQTAYCGYQDFPSPESFKEEVRRTLHSRNEILSIFDANTGATASAPPDGHAGTQAFATFPRQVPRIEHTVSVDASALARLGWTAEPHGTCEIENAASSESNSIPARSNLLQPIIPLRKSGDGAVPPQADQRAENLRQVLLNIKSRRAKA